MDESTINSGTFTLKDDANSEVDGTITLEGGNAILKPSTPLHPVRSILLQLLKRQRA